MATNEGMRKLKHNTGGEKKLRKAETYKRFGADDNVSTSTAVVSVDNIYKWIRETEK